MKKTILALSFVLLFSIVISAQGVSSSDKLSKATSTPQGFNTVRTDDVLDFFNSRPVPANAYRVLFVGDSLTVHSPAQDLWTYYAGMAASDAKHDFVHLAAAHMQAKFPDRSVEIFYCHGNGRLPLMLGYLRIHPEIAPDLVILQGGENDLFDEHFVSTYRELLVSFPKARKIVLSDWNDKTKRDFEQKEAEQGKLPFVDLTAIRIETGTSGNGGPFNHPGVAWHPNDRGMARIAEEIGKVFDSMKLER